MSERRKRSLLGTLFGGVGLAIDWWRRVTVNLLFLAVLVSLLAAAVGGRPRIPSGAALVLNPKGTLVEQLSGDPSTRLAGELMGVSSAPRETLVKDVLDALRLAKDDARITALYLDVDELWGGGLSKLQEIRAALLDFKKSRKKVVAYGDVFLQRSYYLAAHADEVFLNPQGAVLLQGFGGYRHFYKEGLDRLGVQVHVFRVGEYKSAVEPYLRNDMSPEAKEADLDVYGDLWRAYVADVASARKLTPEAVTELIAAAPERLRAAGGDAAKLAQDVRLVDTVASRDLVRKRVIQLVGEDKQTRSFKQIGFERYLAARAGDRAPRGSGGAVAVVVAKGEILDGTQPPGTVGGDSTAALIRRARQDEDVKSVVLRVDSPGGSVFASEVVRRECEITREAGKPVVVSMGSLAASGGYWISTASDEIWASPVTVTGSIGIFALYPTVEKPLAKYLGIHADGVGTTRFSDALRPDRPLDAGVAEIARLAIDRGYEDFLSRVSKARKMTRQQVDKVARGRIWSGEDAKALGLVDQIGNLTQAIESAAKRAKLGKDFRVLYVEKELSLRERLIAGLFTAAVRVGLSPESDGSRSAAPPSPLSGVLGEIQEDAARVARWNDPRGMYAHCLCREQ
jgi:protease IV